MHNLPTNEDDTREIIAFYNLENLFSPSTNKEQKRQNKFSGANNWNTERYQKKIDKIGQVFSEIAKYNGLLPKIFAVCEVAGEQPLRDLLALPIFQNYQYIYFKSNDKRGINTALIYHQEVEILDKKPLQFIENYFTRDILYTKLRLHGELINIFVVHLPSKRDKGRQGPFRNIIIDELRNFLLHTKEKNIVIGDFNTNPSDDNLQNLTHTTKMKNPFLDIYGQHIFTNFYGKMGLSYDQILLSEDFFKESEKLTFDKVEIFSSDTIKQHGRPVRTYAGTRYLGGISDHFPIFVKLKKQ